MNKPRRFEYVVEEFECKSCKRHVKPYRRLSIEAKILKINIGCFFCKHYTDVELVSWVDGFRYGAICAPPHSRVDYKLRWMY